MSNDKIAEDASSDADLAGAWRGRFEDALRRVQDDPSSHIDNLVDVVWKEGILDHVSPMDERERSARKARGREVWLRRTEPELYLLLQYACAYVRQAIVESWTTASGPVAVATVMAAVRTAACPQRFFPPRHDGSLPDPVLVLVDALAQRARLTLLASGYQPHDPLIRCGATGTFKGVAVEVERYLEDGSIWLKGETEADHIALYKWTGGRGVSPAWLDPKSFK